MKPFLLSSNDSNRLKISCKDCKGCIEAATILFNKLHNFGCESSQDPESRYKN